MDRSSRLTFNTVMGRTFWHLSPWQRWLILEVEDRVWMNGCCWLNSCLHLGKWEIIMRGLAGSLGNFEQRTYSFTGHSWPLFSLLSPPHNWSPNCVDSTPKYTSFYLLLSLLIATTCSCTSPTDLGVGSLRLWQLLTSCSSTQHPTGSF